MIFRDLAQSQRQREMILAREAETGKRQRIAVAPSMPKFESNVKSEDLALVEAYYSGKREKSFEPGAVVSSYPSTCASNEISFGQQDTKSTSVSSIKSKETKGTSSASTESVKQRASSAGSDGYSSRRRPILERKCASMQSPIQFMEMEEASDEPQEHSGDQYHQSVITTDHPIVPRKKTRSGAKTAASKLMSVSYSEKYQNQTSPLLRSKTLYTTKMYRDTIDMARRQLSSEQNVIIERLEKLSASPEPKPHGKARIEYESWYAKNWIFSGDLTSEKWEWLQSRNINFDDPEWHKKIEIELKKRAAAAKQSRQVVKEDDQDEINSLNDTIIMPGVSRGERSSTGKGGNARRGNGINTGADLIQRRHRRKDRRPFTVEKLFQFHPSQAVSRDSLMQYTFEDDIKTNTEPDRQAPNNSGDYDDESDDGKDDEDDGGKYGKRNDRAKVLANNEKSRVDCWWKPSEYQAIKGKIESGQNANVSRKEEEKTCTTSWKPVSLYHTPSIPNSRNNLQNAGKSSFWFPSSPTGQSHRLPEITTSSSNGNKETRTLHMPSYEWKYRPYLSSK